MKLSDVRELKEAYLRCKSHVEVLRELATSCRVPELDGLPKAKPSGKSRVENFAQKIVDAENELEIAKAKYLAGAAQLVLEILQRVKNLQAARILLLRYVNLYNWRQIFREVNLSDSQVFALHRRGLKAWRAGESP